MHTRAFAVVLLLAGCETAPSNSCSDRNCGAGTCVEDDGMAFCMCPTGTHEEGGTCVASPTTCDGVDCGEGGTCEVAAGSATCRCEAGFVLSGLMCVPSDVDPCESADCGEGTCIAEISGARCDCPEGQHAVGLTCAADLPIPETGLFVALPATGYVTVMLHPSQSAVGGEETVTFGVPFPRGALASADDVMLTDAEGREIPIHAAELLRWRDGLGATGADSVRAVRITLTRTFGSTDPVEVRLHWGTPRTMNVATAPDAWAGWIAVDDGEYPSGEVMEPAVYATLPAEWLGAALLRHRSLPLGDNGDLAHLDEHYPLFSQTMVNDVDDRVTEDNRVPYAEDYEPWLFDRASVLLGVYFQTGDVRWLRAGHRAAAFYGRHIDEGGFFDLKEDDDLKYSYGAPLLSDLMLTGDTRHLGPIARIADAGTSFNPRYTIDNNFWTERHQTYALLAALTAWEATGEEAHATRVREVIDATIDAVETPPAGWTPQGCPLHTMGSHEGDGSPQPICSPWMLALLADAVFRYYVHSEDVQALELLAGFADWVAEHTLYDGGEEDDSYAGVMVPYYLASSTYTFSDGGVWADIEHTCDTAGLVARGAWAARQLGRDPAALTTTTRTLLDACEINVGGWVRPGGPEAGLSVYRLNPPRKYNWWFGTTRDASFFLSELGG
jgi:hypothetical protein